MATITSYNTLVQAIKDAAEDDGAEFNDFIPTAIDLAEETLFRELELPDLELPIVGNLTQGSATLTKPSDYKFSHSLKIKVGNVEKLLKFKQPDYIADYWPNPTVQGEPKYYGISTANTFIIAPTPDDGYLYELKYSGKPAKLSVSNPTNYYVAQCQDILFAACMLEMSRFMKAWSEVSVWEANYAKIRDSWNINAARGRRDDGSVPNNPDGGPNSLKHTIQSRS